MVSHASLFCFLETPETQGIAGKFDCIYEFNFRVKSYRNAKPDGTGKVPIPKRDLEFIQND